MTLTLTQWHKRYKHQATWTKSIRDYAYQWIEIQNCKSILDIGCGTGVLLEELKNSSPATVIGLDIDIHSLQFAKINLPISSCLTCGDASYLPIKAKSLDVCLCHFLLLWLKDPLRSLIEMTRVTRPGGYILALAEPDYGGRINFPAELEKIGQWQVEALKNQAANPLIGREIRSLFSRAGLIDITVGVLGGQWIETETIADIDSEWEVIRSDLSGNPQFIKEYERLKLIDKESRSNNSRILFVPTFYAIGRVPR